VVILSHINLSSDKIIVMTQIRISILFVLALNFHYGFGQLNSSNCGEQPKLPTWETYEFMKYGNIGASPYTGTVSYSVPIYTYQDNDFEFSVTVNYATNGFRVNHKSGLLGHGWSLSSPGKITREIKGIPDESTKTIQGPGSSSSAILCGYKNMTAGSFQETYLCSSNNQVYTCLVSAGKFYDAEPDIYTFNFCGYSGSFRRSTPADGHGSFVMFNEDSNSRGLSIKSFDEERDIRIIDGDGYEYVFDVDEYTREPRDESEGPIYVDRNRAWHLSEIIAPNGRKIRFNYISATGNELNDSTHNVTCTPTLSYYFASCSGMQFPNNGNSSSSIDVIKNDVFHSKLGRVLFPDSTMIAIKYEDGARELCHVTPNGNLVGAQGEYKRIASIQVSGPDGRVFKKAQFAYEEKSSPAGDGNRLTFLKSIDISGQGVTSFDYYDMAGYPPLGSIKSDHWGYYNGETGGFSTTNLFSNLSYDSFYNESYNSTLRKSPDFTSALSGSLRRIDYPTGSYSVITYEPHDYSSQVVRNSSNQFIPMLVSINDKVQTGGIRLKQVVTYKTDTVPADTIKYEYSSTANPNLSSGILINTPRYGIQYLAQGGGMQKYVKYFNLANHIYDSGSTHIEYSHVRKHRSSSGYTDYTYTSYNTHPDLCDYEENKDARSAIFNWGQVDETTVHCSFTTSDSVTNILTPIPSMQTKRGLLTREENHDAGGILVSRKDYSYSFPEVRLDTVYTVTGEMAREVYYPRFNIQLNRVSETMYYGNGEVTSTTRYTYNGFGRPIATRTITSEGDTILQRNFYAGDSVSSAGIVGLMRRQHLVNSLLHSERVLVSNNTETLLDKQRYSYYQPIDSLVRLQSVEQWSPVNGWDTLECYSHDNAGFLKQKTDASGVPTSYLWSYKGKHPVLVAANAASSILDQMLSGQGLSRAALCDLAVPDDNIFLKLRTIAGNMPTSQVATYKYRPNVGVTEMSSPNSLKTFYAYDGYGRLTAISDNNRHLVEQADYSLATVAPLSASLICPQSCHVNDSTVSISINASGGSHSNSYSCCIRDSLNQVVFQSTNDTGMFSFHPSTSGCVGNKNYTVNCEVTDSISGETVSLSQVLHVKNAAIKFSNMSEPVINMNQGSGTITANIYTDSPTSVRFILNILVSPLGNCDITVGSNPKRSYAGKIDSLCIEFNLSTGDNPVEIKITNSISETEASLAISSAGCHDVGNPNNLSIIF
jgi:YD repeat-containing protein